MDNSCLGQSPVSGPRGPKVDATSCRVVVTSVRSRLDGVRGYPVVRMVRLSGPRRPSGRPFPIIRAAHRRCTGAAGESGGTGRRAGFRFQWVTPVRVRVPPFAPCADSAGGPTIMRRSLPGVAEYAAFPGLGLGLSIRTDEHAGFDRIDRGAGAPDGSQRPSRTGRAGYRRALEARQPYGQAQRAFVRARCR